MKVRLTPEQADELAHRFYADGGIVNEVSGGYSREEITTFLQENVDALCKEVEGMSSAQLAYRLPGRPDGLDESGDEEHFDTSQIMTHMASAIGFHWWNITRALRQERPPMPRAPEGVAVTGKRKDVMGSGGWQGLPAGELCKLLRDTAAGFITYVNQLPADTGEARSSFGLFRDMSPHDWLFVVAMHCATHLVQIREMKSRPDFPA
jgi:hypothetical protein